MLDPRPNDGRPTADRRLSTTTGIVAFVPWDDDSATPSLPPRGERRWVHPSEQQPPTSSPPNAGDTTSPSLYTWVRRRKSLPIGTAIVATATGAVAMFAAVNVLGLTTITAGPVQSTGRPMPATTVSVLTSTVDLAATRRVVAPPSAGRVTITVDNDVREGVVIAPFDVVFSWNDDVDLSTVIVSNADGAVLRATNWTRQSGGLIEVTVPGVSTRRAATAPGISVADALYADSGSGPRHVGSVASVWGWHERTRSCRPVVFGVDLVPGAALWNEDQALVGFVANDDPDPNDALTTVITVDGVVPSDASGCDAPG